MPYVTNGNIYAPVMMLAEKAADLITGKTPLASLHAEFYRHGVSPLERGARDGHQPGRRAAESETVAANG
jgi:choline dehydrogenase